MTEFEDYSCLGSTRSPLQPYVSCHECLQHSRFWVPGCDPCLPAVCDHLSWATIFAWPTGWSLYTGFTVPQWTWKLCSRWAARFQEISWHSVRWKLKYDNHFQTLNKISLFFFAVPRMYRGIRITGHASLWRSREGHESGKSDKYFHFLLPYFISSVIALFQKLLQIYMYFPKCYIMYQVLCSVYVFSLSAIWCTKYCLTFNQCTKHNFTV